MIAWSGGGWSGGPWIALVWILVWAALVIGLVFIFRRRPAHGDIVSSAEGTLGDRYARGEIDADEYRERLRVLRER
jgi:putative membrane protein